MGWQKGKSLEKHRVSLPARKGTDQTHSDRSHLRRRQPTEAIEIELRSIRRKACEINRVVENTDRWTCPKDRFSITCDAHRIGNGHPTLPRTLIEQTRCNRPRADIVVKMPDDRCAASARGSQNMHLQTVRMDDVRAKVGYDLAQSRCVRVGFRSSQAHAGNYPDAAEHRSVGVGFSHPGEDGRKWEHGDG